MISAITKYLKVKNTDHAEWFATKTLQFIHRDLRANISYIQSIKAFYNADVKSCIVKLKFELRHVVDQEHPFLYILLDSNTHELEQYGQSLEQRISDNKKSITWIKNNKVLVFYPNDTIMSLLTKKLQ